MKTGYDLILINPPMATYRPDQYRVGTMFVPKNIRISCINTGILSLATYLDSKGFRIAILDLYKAESAEEARETLRSFLEKNEASCYGVSCGSGFSYLETLDVARLIRQTNPLAKIVTGGQHIGPLKDLPLKECSAIDINVLYEGEMSMEDILNGKAPGDVSGVAYQAEGGAIVNSNYPTFVSLDEMPPLKFSLYPEYKKFTPYIEESRGCYARCNFCISSFTNNGRIRIKSSQVFEKELENLLAYFPNPEIVAILASSFGVNVQNTLNIVDALGRHQVPWTTEIRVDAPWDSDDLLEKMAESGLTILNVGAESLSPEILLKMNKTKNPEAYLVKARALIEACKRFPELMLKFNIVMYHEETPRTFSETLAMLFKYKEYFATVQFSPLFSFPGSLLSSSLPKENLVCDPFWDSIHMHPVNLSAYYDARSAATLCREMEKIFSDPDGYLKANSYKWHKATDNELEEIKNSSWR